MKILLVDDDKTIITLATLSLKKKGGHEVACASDGVAALALAESFQPDLLLLDVGLPGIDGIEVCVRIKSSSKTAHIPVIFLSAKTEPQDLDLMRRAGAAGHITKPFNPLGLSDRIQDILGQGDGKQERKV